MLTVVGYLIWTISKESGLTICSHFTTIRNSIWYVAYHVHFPRTSKHVFPTPQSDECFLYLTPPPSWRSHYNQLNWDTIVMVQWALISIASLLYLPYVANVRRIFYFLQVMIMYVLDRRLKSSGIGVFALHPGLVESNILPNSPNVFVHIAHRFMKLFRKFPVAPLCVPWKKSTKTLTDDYLQNHNNNDNNKQNKTEDMKQYFLWRKY